MEPASNVGTRSARWDVFISYSTKDRKQVGYVVEDLVGMGFRVWQDDSAITFADRIREKIYEGIDNSALALIFISPRSLQSKWVVNELDAAMLREVSENKAFVVPVLMGVVTVADLPGDLRGKKYIDLRGGFRRKYEAARPRLVALIKSASSVGENRELRSEMLLGSDFVRFLLSYTISLARERSRVSRPLISDFVSDFTRNLAEMYVEMEESGEKEDVTEGRAAKRQFVERYGMHAVEKLFEFCLDQCDISFTGGCTEEEIVAVCNMVDATVRMFYLQSKVARDRDLDFNIHVGIAPDGKLGFLSRPKAPGPPIAD